MYSSSDMNREQTIRLIQRYSEHRLLWDKKHPHHLSTKLRKENWTKIANEYRWPISALKKKMASLLGSHRRELHRERRSRIRAAATGSKYIYSSKWFGFPYFDFMRKNRNKHVRSRNTKPIEGSQPSPQTTNEDTDASSAELQQSHSAELEQVMIMSPRHPVRNKRRSSSEPPKEDSESEYEDENSLTKSLNFLKNASNATNDPYITFGNYIVSELRKYDPRTLACVKHAIHNVIFEADLGKIRVNTSDHLAHLPSSSSFVSEAIPKCSPAASDASSS